MRTLLPICCLGIAAAFVLPTFAATAQAAVPFLAVVVVCVLVWRLVFPPTTRRR